LWPMFAIERFYATLPWATQEESTLNSPPGYGSTSPQQPARTDLTDHKN
jgi:hypothetical protein